MEKYQKNSRLKENQNSNRQTPNSATSPQPASGAHGSIFWAPAGLYSLTPHLQPCSLYCMWVLLAWIFSVPAEVQIPGISYILGTPWKLGLQLHAQLTQGLHAENVTLLHIPDLSSFVGPWRKLPSAHASWATFACQTSITWKITPSLCCQLEM